MYSTQTEHMTTVPASAHTAIRTPPIRPAPIDSHDDAGDSLRRDRRDEQIQDRLEALPDAPEVKKKSVRDDEHGEPRHAEHNAAQHRQAASPSLRRKARQGNNASTNLLHSRTWRS